MKEESDTISDHPIDRSCRDASDSSVQLYNEWYVTKNDIVAEELLIEPDRIDKNYWTDLWRYRELFAVLVWRDVSVKYKQTMIGMTWVGVRPIVMMVILTFVFDRVAKMSSSSDAPYPLTVFAALIPWMLFSSGLADAANSLIGNERLISKVYFPRLLLPTATITATALDLLVNLGITILLMAYYHFLPTWKIVFLPGLVLWAILTTIGPGLWLTALNVKYRDIRYTIPFLLQFGLYISPVGFSSDRIPTHWRWLYSLNPIVGLIDAFRWCLLGDTGASTLPNVAVSILMVGVLMWLGVRRFRHMERTFADLI